MGNGEASFGRVISPQRFGRAANEHMWWLETGGGEGKKLEFQGADLRKVRFQGKVLRKTDLRGANLEGSNLRGVDFRGAKLQRANLLKCDLTDSDFQWSDLSFATLALVSANNAKFSGANLQGANLVGANLSSAKIKRTNFLDAIFFQTIVGDTEQLSRAYVSDHSGIFYLNEQDALNKRKVLRDKQAFEVFGGERRSVLKVTVPTDCSPLQLSKILLLVYSLSDGIRVGLLEEFTSLPEMVNKIFYPNSIGADSDMGSVKISDIYKGTYTFSFPIFEGIAEILDILIYKKLRKKKKELEITRDSLGGLQESKKSELELLSIARREALSEIETLRRELGTGVFSESQVAEISGQLSDRLRDVDSINQRIMAITVVADARIIALQAKLVEVGGELVIDDNRLLPMAEEPEG